MLERLRNAFAIGEGVDGLKGIIGVMLIVAASQLQAVRDLMVAYPDASFLSGIADSIQQVMGWLETAMQWLGSSLLGYSLLWDKVRKFFGWK